MLTAIPVVRGRGRQLSLGEVNEVQTPRGRVRVTRLGPPNYQRADARRPQRCLRLYCAPAATIFGKSALRSLVELIG